MRDFVSESELLAPAKTPEHPPMPVNETERVLREARALVADPSHWLKGEIAQTAEGAPCAPEDKRAVRFCMVGAYIHARHALNTQSDNYLRLVEAVGTRHTPPSFDNAATTSHAKMLAAFDRAIALARTGA
jgi:hypothetical protein